MGVSELVRQMNREAGAAAYIQGRPITDHGDLKNIECISAFKDGYQAASLAAEKAKLDGVKKYDSDKAPVMQGVIGRFPLALKQVAFVSEYGQRKYGTYDGWEKLPEAFLRYDDALGRHALLRSSEGEYDVNDSGLPHLAQRAWNALATLEIALREGIVEMTPGNQIGGDALPILGSNGRTNAPS